MTFADNKDYALVLFDPRGEGLADNVLMVLGLTKVKDFNGKGKNPFQDVGDGQFLVVEGCCSNVQFPVAANATVKPFLVETAYLESLDSFDRENYDAGEAICVVIEGVAQPPAVLNNPLWLKANLLVPNGG